MADNRPLEPHGKRDLRYDKDTGLGVLTRKWKVKGKYTKVAELPTSVKRDFETPDEEFTTYLLNQQYIDGTESPDGEVSILVEVYIELPADPETLIQSGSDVILYSDNGLKLVEQRFFCRRTHTLTGTVGTTVGDSGEINGLYLSWNGFTERGKVSAIVVKRWAEAGILSKSFGRFSDGVRPVTVVGQGVKPTVSGIISNTEIGNFEGFQTWTVLAFQNAAGGEPTSGAIPTRQIYANFQYPGIANPYTKIVDYPGVTIRFMDIDHSPQVTVPILSTVKVTYQTSNVMPALDYPLWAPKEWARYDATWIDTSDQPQSRGAGIRGYRAATLPSKSISHTSAALNLAAPFGSSVPVGNTATITVTGGPEDPVGNTYVINKPELEEAFTKEDGTIIYKLVQVIATIPPLS